MNFYDVMQKFNGRWEDGRALIQESGYTWCIATGNENQFVLTSDGKRYASTDAPAPVDKPKRGRRPASPVLSTDM